MSSINSVLKQSKQHRIQLLKNIDNLTLICALVGLSKRWRKPFYECVSKSAADQLESEIKFVGHVAQSHIDRANEEILKVSKALLAKPANHAALRAKGKKIESRIKASLKKKPVSAMTNKELASFYSNISQLAETTGLLSVENVLDKINCPMVNYSLALIIDGTAPRLVMEIMNARIQSALEEHQRRRKAFGDGIISVFRGDNPVIVRAKMLSHCCPETRQGYKDIKPSKNLPAQIKKVIKSKPLASCFAHELIDPFVLMSHYSRTSGILPLKSLLKQIRDSSITPYLSLIGASDRAIKGGLALERIKSTDKIEVRLELIKRAAIAIQKGTSAKDVKAMCLMGA